MNKEKIFSIVVRAFALVVMMNSALWAMGAAPRDPNAPQPPAWAQYAPMIMLVAVFYFFLLRPQAKQRKERDAMLGALKKGDKIITQSGFVVTVSTVGPKFLEVKLNDETRVRMARSGVAEVLPESVDAELTAVTNGK